MLLLTNGTARTINSVFSMSSRGISITCEPKFKFECPSVKINLD